MLFINQFIHLRVGVRLGSDEVHLYPCTQWLVIDLNSKQFDFAFRQFAIVLSTIPTPAELPLTLPVQKEQNPLHLFVVPKCQYFYLHFYGFMGCFVRAKEFRVKQFA